MGALPLAIFRSSHTPAAANNAASKAPNTRPAGTGLFSASMTPKKITRPHHDDEEIPQPLGGFRVVYQRREDDLHHAASLFFLCVRFGGAGFFTSE